LKPLLILWIITCSHLYTRPNIGTHLCISVDGSLPEGRIRQPALPFPNVTIADQQAISGKTAAWEECRAFLPTIKSSSLVSVRLLSKPKTLHIEARSTPWIGNSHKQIVKELRHHLP
jgi:hypothetical protein